MVTFSEGIPGGKGRRKVENLALRLLPRAPKEVSSLALGP